MRENVFREADEVCLPCPIEADGQRGACRAANRRCEARGKQSEGSLLFARQSDLIICSGKRVQPRRKGCIVFAVVGGFIQRRQDAVPRRFRSTKKRFGGSFRENDVSCFQHRRNLMGCLCSQQRRAALQASCQRLFAQRGDR